MKYSSTRGGEEDLNLTFLEAIMRGLALDAGLFVPNTIPTVSTKDLNEWATCKEYYQVAYRVMRLFISEDEIPNDDLLQMVKDVYAPGKFRDPKVAPTTCLKGAMNNDKDLYLLELFHGPTFAFKDVALQFLGRLFSYNLTRSKSKMTVLAATSGDTGSSAIHGLRGQSGVDCFVMFPKGGPSQIQQRQMTTVQDSNVHCIAVEGDFDDCQKIVKDLFNERSFRHEVQLGAVNSINWARILAQIVYYFWSYFEVQRQNVGGSVNGINFVVPTGNFGDILAGYYAARMGCPTNKLVVATNQNDILDRFFKTGTYHYTGGSVNTPAPSMDISVSSNFERFLYHCCGDDAKKTKEMMKSFKDTDEIRVTKEAFEHANQYMASGCVDDKTMLETILSFKSKYGTKGLLDPHTAIGVSVATNDSIHNISKELMNSIHPVVCLACAHWAKFPKVMNQAKELNITNASELEHDQNLVPTVLKELASMKQRVDVLQNDKNIVRSFVRSNVQNRSSNEVGLARNTLFGVALLVGAVSLFKSFI
jgi:threonine synthase